MTKKTTRKSTKKQLAFRNKLVLNQWLISLFGIGPLAEHKLQGKTIRRYFIVTASGHWAIKAFCRPLLQLR